MSLTILVVEHNRMIRTMYTAGLAGYGHDVIEAQTVTEAHQLLRSGLAPDVVITEMRLPDGDGYDVMRLVEENTHRAEVRVILATSQDITAETSRELAADAYLPKPLGIVELLEAL